MNQTQAQALRVLNAMNEKFERDAALHEEKFNEGQIKRMKRAILIVLFLASIFVVMNFSLWFFTDNVNWVIVLLGSLTFVFIIAPLLWVQRGQKQKLTEVQAQIVLKE